MSTKSKIIIAALAAAGIIGGAVLAGVGLKQYFAQRPTQANSAGEMVVNTGATGLDADIRPDFGGELSQSDFKNFVHLAHNFSFDYPAGWNVDSFAAEGEEAVVVDNAETGIVIYIYPFDEPGPLTRERVLRDVPDMKMANERRLNIAGISALGFDSNERETGPTREVWFVHDGYLYQISASPGSEEALYQMVETWKF